MSKHRRSIFRPARPRTWRNVGTNRPTLPRLRAGAHRPAPLTVERLAGLLGLMVTR